MTSLTPFCVTGFEAPSDIVVRAVVAADLSQRTYAIQQLVLAQSVLSLIPRAINNADYSR
jgi:hypothetical protein